MLRQDAIRLQASALRVALNEYTCPNQALRCVIQSDRLLAYKGKYQAYLLLQQTHES